MLMVVSGLATPSCARQVQGDGGVACTVGHWMDAPAVLAACGLPNGLKDQPKIGGGSWFSFQLCSAPAYIYEKEAVLFGCDGTVDSVITLVPESYQGIIASPTRDLIDDIKRGGPHLAARLAQLQHQDRWTDLEPLGYENILRDAEASSDPFVRSAAQRVRDSRTLHR
jgi:hypothetical protein